jgi:Zn-dependent peptidase ImmA (M78 family)
MERGEADPTRAQIARMARAYRRPLVAFYLAEPPRTGERGQDFRTATVPPPEEEQAWLDALIRELRARHALVRVALEEEEDVTPVGFVGATSLEEGVEAVAGEMGRLLAFDRAVFRDAPSLSDAFSYLRERVESCGVFALLVGDLGSYRTAISPETFRGYALADAIAPMIVVNDRDARSAWSFTLLHEFCHLLLGASGVSGGFAGLRIEQFCNDAASRLLLDEAELRALQGRDRGPEAAAADIGSFARQRNLSRSMVAFRLFRAGLIPERRWEELATAFKLEWLAHRERTRTEYREQTGGPSYYVVRRHRLGPALLETVNYLLKSGGVSVVKAGRILGVKPTNVGETLAGHFG